MLAVSLHEASPAAVGRWWTEIPISEKDRAIANVMQLEETRISEELSVFCLFVFWHESADRYLGFKRFGMEALTGTGVLRGLA